MKIDRKMNIVIPIDVPSGVDDKGADTFVTYYVHAAPISREVFERYFALFGRTFDEMGEIGSVGFRLAGLTLKSVAQRLDVLDEVENGLIPEMRRLASVITPAPAFEVLPWQTAIDKKMFDEDDTREVENVLTFFMVSWQLSSKKRLDAGYRVMIGLGVLEGTSSTPMAYANSLRTSTELAASPPRGTVSSIPV